MYVPKHFIQGDGEKTASVVESHAFGLLVTVGSDGLPVGSHIPFLSRTTGDALILEGHVARPNEQSEHIRQGLKALAVFRGPHAYISPTWYETPGVPTWNYDAVHVYGRLQEVSGEGARSIVERLARKFEGDGPDAWVPSYPEKMLSGIVCFVMTEASVQSKSKMNQNRPANDRRSVIEALARFDDQDSRDVRRIMLDNESGDG
jgi:transcriptional regulator